MAQPQYIEIALPPGVYANGTARESGSDGPTGPRWRDSNLVRWPNGTDMQPVGGWQLHNSSASAMTGAARAIETWRDLQSRRWIAVGTHSHLYAMSESGSLFDITPSGFTVGRADATTGIGYGEGAYGTGSYGVARPDTSSIIPATVWNLDAFGEDLLGCTVDDGKLYAWPLNTASAAAVISGAPTNLTGMHVTANQFAMAFQHKTVNWSDVGDYTTWSASSTNQAGDLPLNTDGSLTCGRSIRGGELLFTDVDLWLATYSSNTNIVWGFEQVGRDCGTIAKGSPIVVGNQVVWMGQNSFWNYNGFVTPLPCDVAGAVFDNINTVQASKVTGFHNAPFSECWWFFPSAASTEIDSYCFWNYKYNHWAVGKLARTCAIGPGIFTPTLAVGTDGKIYEHEIGFQVGGVFPYARSGPFEIGAGDAVARVLNLIPDEKTLGDSQVTFYARFYPNGTETAYGPFETVSPGNGPVNCRFMARQSEIKVEFTGADDARAGLYRVQFEPAGRR